MAGYIDSIDPTSPITSDDPEDFPAEMRTFKSYVQDSFPNVAGEVSSTHTELNLLAGATVSTAEINYSNGVTSGIQAQIDALSGAGGITPGVYDDQDGYPATYLDLTSASYIGDMVSGGGLAAVFDGNAAVSGYAAAVTGYAGVDLSAAPKRIHSGLFASGSNGFDGSGSATDITLSLYGKTGGAPSNGTDGTLLGTTGTFVDPNTEATYNIQSTDRTTEWDYVWGYVTSGVWSQLAELYVYESELTGAETVPDISTSRMMLSRSINTLTPYTFALSELSQFRIRFELSATAMVRAEARVETVHRGDITGWNGAVGIGIRVYYRTGASEVALDAASFGAFTKNAVGGSNLIDRTDHHYQLNLITDAQFLAIGFYEFTIYATAHSTGSGLDGLAGVLVEGNHGLNRFLIDVDPSCDVVEF